MLSGNYVNFAICDYYNDTIFTDMTRCILCSITTSDLGELRHYAKVDKKVHSMLYCFFNTQLVHLFTNFEAGEIEQVLKVLSFGTTDRLYEVQSDSINALNLLNEFVFEQIRTKPVPQGHKNYKLQTKVNSFASGQ